MTALIMRGTALPFVLPLVEEGITPAHAGNSGEL